MRVRVSHRGRRLERVRLRKDLDMHQSAAWKRMDSVHAALKSLTRDASRELFPASRTSACAMKEIRGLSRRSSSIVYLARNHRFAGHIYHAPARRVHRLTSKHVSLQR